MATVIEEPEVAVAEHAVSSPLPTVWTWAALAVSLAALAGSLGLSIFMGLKACPLCLYQRTFVMGVVAVLLMGLLAGAHRVRILNFLALPAAVAGLGVAGFHVYLELAGKLECPAGVLGIGSAPMQSLAVLVLLSVILWLGAMRDGLGCWKLTAALVVGVLLTVSSVLSAPPLPAPKKPESPKIDMCRPPYLR